MERLVRVRKKLQEQGLTGLIIPITNAFQGEYSPDADKRLQWLTGFTGSNGMAIVLQDKAAFWTDGRYTLQAQQEVDGDAYERLDFAQAPAHKWLQENTEAGQVIAYDPWLHTKKQLTAFVKAAKEAGFALKAADSLLDPLWTDRPAAPQAPLSVQPRAFAGRSAEDKRQEIADVLKQKHATAVVLSAGDSICWLLNVRGGDLPYTPFALAFAILHQDTTVDLFIDPQKISPSVQSHLGEGVRVKALAQLETSLQALAEKRVLIDPARVASWFFDKLEALNADIMETEDPCQLPKATKNETELEGARQAHIRDGVAVTKFLCWFDKHAPAGTETEQSAAAQLLAYRKEQDHFQEPSFETISGYGPNGAIIHYRVSDESNLPIKTGSLYLVDSGGQYLDGTTDITRTLPVGAPTEEQSRHFTLVLKGMIQLTLAQFPKGTAGGQLDVLARHALWQAGLDYAHGTGHGIGSYLSVHEGPQGISHRSHGAKLAPGILLSNEPGYYKEGSYGIRIENVIVVVEKPEASTDDKPFYGFETLTLAPIDKRLIQKELLTEQEQQWLNAYHKRVRDTLSDFLDETTQAWLSEATSPL